MGNSLGGQSGKLDGFESYNRTTGLETDQQKLKAEALSLE